jgi:hypothetical protein
MIVGTFNKIPCKTTSHNYGWARTWAENLGLSIDHENGVHDVVHLSHGVNFGGSLNLFGGFTEELKQAADNLMLSKQIYSLDIDCPDYGAMLKTRKDVVDKDWCDRLSQKLSSAKTIVSSDLDFDWLAVGDSHTAAYSRKNSCVVKKDGTTLFGQIKEDFAYLRQHINKKKWRGVTISLGNIDVRHHICRNKADIKPMIEKLKQFGDSLGCEVEYSLPWPIEFEARRLPKTGYYKGEPFSGSQKERAAVVDAWKKHMQKINMNIVSCPDDWYTMHPEAYASEKMEKPQSVHLSPECYRRQNWGKVENSLENFFG